MYMYAADELTISYVWCVAVTKAFGGTYGNQGKLARMS